MKDEASKEEAWEKDRLGFKDIGHAFTNLIRSIDTEKVISIEAGFGRGKTFFRKAWAKQLKSAGEVVVEVDVQQSDHSGDPVITLLGALVDALPKGEKAHGKKALESAKKVAAIGARSLARAVLKAGADEVLEALTDNAIDQLEDFDALDDVIKGVGAEMSKAAGQLIASQMAAEKVRKTELPEQLKTLQAALVDGTASKRVVVIIDELDRCHPDYAISFLEATKLIFGRSGFVFCLMVNADYLENLARHRFGVAMDDERYLDKFVDIRLRLDPKPEAFKTAVYQLACDLPLNIPYGENKAFSVKQAAELASRLAVECGFSMRKTKRILLKVELALRCYADRPLDAPLLVFMAFKDESPTKVNHDHLPRSFLTPEEGERLRSQSAGIDLANFHNEQQRDARLNW
ncbi:KAP family P-loop NTPase fold protein [Szabonella alba]|uniref:NTPase n=1 Tax=Szabonella alba TaxID=2804194 RepID=A0A8K0VFR5_9RHOB|nr:P-loop NTPase fold protein [Szabonella alba]MBL4919438.1 NTPase [Szabonella alba]